MAKNCQTCRKALSDTNSTHCSDKCLFEIVTNAGSLSEVPIKFDIDSEPWV